MRNNIQDSTQLKIAGFHVHRLDRDRGDVGTEPNSAG